MRNNGADVQTPEVILHVEYDAVLMAIAQYEVARKAADGLVTMGIPACKIRFVDTRELTDDRLRRFYEGYETS